MRRNATNYRAIDQSYPKSGDLLRARPGTAASRPWLPPPPCWPRPILRDIATNGVNVSVAISAGHSESRKTETHSTETLAGRDLNNPTIVHSTNDLKYIEQRFKTRDERFRWQASRACAAFHRRAADGNLITGCTANNGRSSSGHAASPASITIIFLTSAPKQQKFRVRLHASMGGYFHGHASSAAFSTTVSQMKYAVPIAA